MNTTDKIAVSLAGIALALSCLNLLLHLYIKSGKRWKWLERLLGG